MQVSNNPDYVASPSAEYGQLYLHLTTQAPTLSHDAVIDQLVWLSENYADVVHKRGREREREQYDHYRDFFQWLDIHCSDVAYRNQIDVGEDNIDAGGAAHQTLLRIVAANLLTEEFLDEAFARMVMSGLHNREGLT